MDYFHALINLKVRCCPFVLPLTKQPGDICPTVCYVIYTLEKKQIAPFFNTGKLRLKVHSDIRAGCEFGATIPERGRSGKVQIQSRSTLCYYLYTGLYTLCESYSLYDCS